MRKSHQSGVKTEKLLQVRSRLLCVQPSSGTPGRPRGSSAVVFSHTLPGSSLWGPRGMGGTPGPRLERRPPTPAGSGALPASPREPPLSFAPGTFGRGLGSPTSSFIAAQGRALCGVVGPLPPLPLRAFGQLLLEVCERQGSLGSPLSGTCGLQRPELCPPPVWAKGAGVSAARGSSSDCNPGARQRC